MLPGSYAHCQKYKKQLDFLQFKSRTESESFYLTLLNILESVSGTENHSWNCHTTSFKKMTRRVQYENQVIKTLFILYKQCLCTGENRITLPDPSTDSSKSLDCVDEKRELLTYINRGELLTQNPG